MMTRRKCRLHMFLLLQFIMDCRVTPLRGGPAMTRPG
jgi:hypothetical protein